MPAAGPSSAGCRQALLWALAVVRDLRAAGLSCRLDTAPGLGHALPADFDSRLVGLLSPEPTV